jgi:hypothetical protein
MKVMDFLLYCTGRIGQSRPGRTDRRASRTSRPARMLLLLSHTPSWAVLVGLKVRHVVHADCTRFDMETRYIHTSINK